jgi:hypothetical protein
VRVRRRRALEQLLRATEAQFRKSLVVTVSRARLNLGTAGQCCAHGAAQCFRALAGAVKKRKRLEAAAAQVSASCLALR